MVVVTWVAPPVPPCGFCGPPQILTDDEQLAFATLSSMGIADDLAMDAIDMCGSRESDLQRAIDWSLQEPKKIAEFKTAYAGLEAMGFPRDKIIGKVAMQLAFPAPR